MQFEEQGTLGSERYTVVPRTLIFITAGDDLLLLRGAPTKRIWPNRLNGLGGHIEAAESPLQSARREIREEAGLEVDTLDLRGIIHVAGSQGAAGVMLLVYIGTSHTQITHPSAEGSLEWHALADLPYDEMVEDLPHLLPLLFDRQRRESFVYGHYATDSGGKMHYSFVSLP